METKTVIQSPAADAPPRVTLEITADVGTVLNAIAGLSEAANLFTHDEDAATGHGEAVSGVALANMLLSRALAESGLGA